MIWNILIKLYVVILILNGLLDDVGAKEEQKIN